VPILVGAELKVIAGHGRLLACSLLGRKEVPTINLEHLTKAQARAFMIADNRLTESPMSGDRELLRAAHTAMVREPLSVQRCCLRVAASSVRQDFPYDIG
jgi:ParB-like chromosome segregation protein Spo0J